MNTIGSIERHQPRIVVLGAGFGGLAFCKKSECPDADIKLVDRKNHHVFQPLLYKVATAGLSAPEIARPIRSILRHRRNVTVLLGDVTGVDLSRHEVRLGHTIYWKFQAQHSRENKPATSGAIL